MGTVDLAEGWGITYKSLVHMLQLNKYVTTKYVMFWVILFKTSA